MDTITIYTADCRGNVNNSRYPQKHIITSLEEFREAVEYDHVCALATVIPIGALPISSVLTA